MPEPMKPGGVSKHVWINLTGPAVEPLTKAFFQPSVTVLQENMGAKIGAKGVTTQAEDKTQKEVGRIKPETVPPTMIVMAGTARAQTYIKVQKMYRIVLLGDTRAGKSSLANTIFGEDVFKMNNSECQAESKSVHGRRITLINTPDFFGPGTPEKDLKSEIMGCITKCAPGPHAFVIVLKVEKSTKHQKAVIEKICQYFSEEALKYATVVFTQDDQLSEGMKIKKLVSQNKCLSDLVKKCKGQCHFTDNKYNQPGDSIRNQSLVEAVLNTIDQIVKENKGRCYTSKMLPQGDTCNKANDSVCKDRLIKLTGPAAESVANAFFGPAVVVLTQGSTTGEQEGEKEEEGEATSKTVNKVHSGQMKEPKETEKGKPEGKTNEDEPPNETGGKREEGDGLRSFVGALFGLVLGLGGPLLRGGVAFMAAAMAGAIAVGRAAAAAAAVAGAGGTGGAAGATGVTGTDADAAGAGGAAGNVAKALKSILAVGGVTGTAWVERVIQKTVNMREWLKHCELMVVVFFSLLVTWFFLKVPFFGTLLVLLLFLLVLGIREVI